LRAPKGDGTLIAVEDAGFESVRVTVEGPSVVAGADLWWTKRTCPPARAKALLATVRPCDIAGKVRRPVAAEFIVDLERSNSLMVRAGGVWPAKQAPVSYP